MSKRINLVDGDIIAFRAAAANEKRSVLVKHLPTGKEKAFDTRTDFRKMLKGKKGDNWKDYEQDYFFTDVQEAADVSHALATIRNQLDKLKSSTGASRQEIFVGGSENFRSTLPLPTQYKGSRGDFLRPVHLIEAKHYLEHTKKAEISVGIEADDLLSIRGYEILKEGHEPVICSLDKDTYQGSGLSIYNWTDQMPEVFKVPDTGYLVDLGKQGIKGCGFKFLCFQLIWADPVDNYKATEVAGIRYGAKSAFKDLNSLTTNAELCNKVVEKFKLWYPGDVQYTSWSGAAIKTDWKGMLDLYYKCVYMLREHNDKITWEEFFLEKGWHAN